MICERTSKSLLAEGSNVIRRSGASLKSLVTGSTTREAGSPRQIGLDDDGRARFAEFFE